MIRRDLTCKIVDLMLESLRLSPVDHLMTNIKLAYSDQLLDITKPTLSASLAELITEPESLTIIEKIGLYSACLTWLDSTYDVIQDLDTESKLKLLKTEEELTEAKELCISEFVHLHHAFITEQVESEELNNTRTPNDFGSES